MSTIKTISNLLGIHIKIPDTSLRVMYYVEKWGLSQETIGEMEGCSQQRISVYYQKAHINSPRNIEKALDIHFTVDEIRYLQFLPREIIKDLQVIAVVNNLLGLEVYHPFYQHFEHTVNMRIGALASLGVRNNHLQKLFNRSQTGISMLVKRFGDKINLERPNRYDSTATFSLGLQKRKTNFLLAGGQEQ